MNSANATQKAGQSAFRKIGNATEFRVDERALAGSMREEIRTKLPQLEARPGEPNLERLRKTAEILASLEDRKIRSVAVFIVKTVGNECVEKEVQLYDKSDKLLATAVWKPDTGINFTRIH